MVSHSCKVFWTGKNHYYHAVDLLILVDYYNQSQMSESDALRRWELRILSSIKKEAKSEKRIAKFS